MLLLLLCSATCFKDFGLGWWRRLGERSNDYDAVEGKQGGMASASNSEAVAVAALDFDSVFVVCGIIGRLAMLLVSWGSLSPEKKSRWRGH